MNDPSGPPAPEDTDVQSTSDIVEVTSLSTGVLVFLVVIWSLVGHKIASRSLYIGEGSAASILGLLTGVALLAFHRYINGGLVGQLLQFNAAGFFTYLLPPVIFYCGISVEKKRFFQNLPSILLYGVLGTLSSFVIISLFIYGFTVKVFSIQDCLALGAIFSATDSVATLQVINAERMPLLFSLVFGEGVINDATSVVLVGAVQRIGRVDNHVPRLIATKFLYLFFTSLCLGIASGLCIAFTLKRYKCHGPYQEVALVGLSAYFSYLAAEALGLSGILSLFCCGIVVSHYALDNLSAVGRTSVDISFRTLSYLSEGMIFIYVGMDALDPLKWKSSHPVEAMWLLIVILVLLAASRALFVVPFSILHNLWSTERLTSRDIVIIWWAGMMRGAVSVALVYFHFDDKPNEVVDRQRATLIVTTLMAVLVSILGCGALTKPLIGYLLSDTSDQLPLLEHLRTISHLGRPPSAAEGRGGGNSVLTRFSGHYQRVADREDAGQTSLTAGYGVSVGARDSTSIEMESLEAPGPASRSTGYLDSIGGLWSRIDETYLKPVFTNTEDGGGSQPSLLMSALLREETSHEEEQEQLLDGRRHPNQARRSFGRLRRDEDERDH